MSKTTPNAPAFPVPEGAAATGLTKRELFAAIFGALAQIEGVLDPDDLAAMHENWAYQASTAADMLIWSLNETKED